MAKGRNHQKGKAQKPSPSESTSGDEVFCAGWIWWSASAGAARKPPKDHFDKKIPADIRTEFHGLMTTYRDKVHELTHGLHYENIGDEIWELKIKRHGNPYRLLFFRWGNYAVALDVFHKTTQKTPKDVALDRKAKWLKTRGDTPPK
jgi:phage-related protein